MGTRRRFGMTLVEVMIAMVAFSIAVLGGIGVIVFSLRTMSRVRANTQMTQILMSEMESLRMRTWADRAVTSAPGGVLYGIRSLGMGQARIAGADVELSSLKSDNEDCLWAWRSPGFSAGAMYKVTPFAVYGSPIIKPASGKIVAKVGEDVAVGAVRMQIPESKIQITRYVYLYKSDWGDPSITEPDMAGIYLTATWTDDSGTHSRGITTTVSRYGINDYIVRSVPEAAPAP